jgi:hypothetical protein
MALHVEQDALLDLLRESRAVTLAAVASLDLASPFDQESNRRGRDMLAHLAAGEAATVRALAAHLAGAAETGAAPDHPALAPPAPPEEIFQRWQQQREQLQATLAKLAWQDYHRRLAVAGGTMFIGEIVKRLIGHEQFHVRALLAAAGQPQPFDGSADQ